MMARKAVHLAEPLNNQTVQTVRVIVSCHTLPSFENLESELEFELDSDSERLRINTVNHRFWAIK